MLSKDRAQDLLERFSAEAAVQDSFTRLSVQGVFGDLIRKSLFSSPQKKTL